MTKMIIAIIDDFDTEPVTQGLQDLGLHVSNIASTGGFLRQGRNTLMVGVKDDQVDEAIKTINKNCEAGIEPIHKKATLFILNVEYFEQL